MDAYTWDWREAEPETPAPLRCEHLEGVLESSRFTREQLSGLGIRGIQFGCSWRLAPAFLNTDMFRAESDTAVSRPDCVSRIDNRLYYLEMDASKPFPLEDGCFDWAYSEHMIEHLTLPDGIRWLREVRRVLAPGGILRLTTPDLGKYVNGYLGGDFYATHREEMHTMGARPPMPKRKAFMMNQIFYLWGHRWIYDEAELRYALTASGFDAEGIEVREYQDSSVPEMADHDRADRRDESIYIEARV
ncbi:class I SAM-dependent methyltransferase [Streptomyces alanosinicus]|nr:methyltransferase domain-containing protein [Streptomyces alanosinicus]